MSFFDLPTEVRLLIYPYLLTGDYSPVDWIHPAILRTCRTIHDEAISILYSSNLFKADSTFPLSILYVQLPEPFYGPGWLVPGPCHCPSYMSFIRRLGLVVRLDCDLLYDPNELLNVFPGLKELRIECDQSSYGVINYSALATFPRIWGLEKAIVYGCCGNRYANWLAGRMTRKIEDDGQSDEFLEGWQDWDRVGTSRTLRYG
ncbi:hypothetical protein MMC25_007683 [Agyrium rufum]|nr:hypothetical protein [Agyrium rufum]